MAAARILVVDDEPAVVEFVQRALHKPGFEIVSATSPHRALEIVKDGPPVDLLVSDVVMPEMRGPELFQEISRFSPATGCILMSGYVAADEVPAGLPLIRKPFSPKALLAKVEDVLARACAAREASQEQRAVSRHIRQQSAELGRDVQELREQTQRSLEQAISDLDRIKKNKPAQD